MSNEKIIFSMAGVSKIYPSKKQVLKNIYLSFFYGAKIGVLGLNGSGKSSLLRIIAGVDPEFLGEVVFSPGYKVGYLEQEPKLDPGKTVKETVREGVCSFGAPVFDASGRVVAGVAVCINKALLGADRSDRYRDAVLSVARTLSQRLGGEVPAATAPAAGRQRKAGGNA